MKYQYPLSISLSEEVVNLLRSKDLKAHLENYSEYQGHTGAVMESLRNGELIFSWNSRRALLRVLASIPTGLPQERRLLTQTHAALEEHPGFVETDFRHLSRDPDSGETKVWVVGRARTPLLWLRLGRASVDSQGLRARLASAVDQEGDSCYLLTMPLVAVSMVRVYEHTTEVTAFIHPSSPDFQVPWPGYDPFTGDVGRDGMKVANYLPPVNHELYQAVKGLEIKIHFSYPERT